MFEEAKASPEIKKEIKYRAEVFVVPPPQDESASVRFINLTSYNFEFVNMMNAVREII